MMGERDLKGYGLMELMLVVVVIGILSFIAYPSYQQHTLKVKRVQMMVALQDIATKIHNRSLLEGSYRQIDLTTVFAAYDAQTYRQPLDQSSATDAVKLEEMANLYWTYPQGDQPLYTVVITPINTDTQKLASAHWILTATPIEKSMMENDGVLTLDYQGKRCHRDSCSDEVGWSL